MAHVVDIFYALCNAVDATVAPSSLALVKSRMVLPFWYQLTQVVLEKFCIVVWSAKTKIEFVGG